MLVEKPRADDSKAYKIFYKICVRCGDNPKKDIDKMYTYLIMGIVSFYGVILITCFYLAFKITRFL